MSFMAGRRESGDLILERQGKGNFSDFKRLSSSVEGGRQSAPRLTPGGQVPFDFFQAPMAAIEKSFRPRDIKEAAIPLANDEGRSAGT